MFNVGGGEIIVILLLALLVLGPDKLPSTAKKVGRFLHEVRRMTSGFEQEVRQALDFENLAGTDPNGTAPSGTPSSTDAITRTTDGPTLAPQRPAQTAPSAPDAPAGSPSPGSAAFVADLSMPRSFDDGD